VTFSRGVRLQSGAPAPSCLRRWSTQTPGRGKTCRSRTESGEEAFPLPIAPGIVAVVALSGLAVIYLGISPGRLLDVVSGLAGSIL